MKYAIISDIHSNLEALLAVLEDAERRSCDKIISLGDIVGYGASPNQCVELIRENSAASIIGNHDKVAAGIEEPLNFNQVAREAALWTRENLTYENKEYLAGLSESKDYGNFIIVHGAISNPDKYITARFEAESEFGLMRDAGVCFFGHTHVPAAYLYKDNTSLVMSDIIEIEKDAKYLINPGSVGQPRDRDPRASYLIYDERGSVEFRKVSYDIKAAQKKIIEAGLNKALAQRLAYGY